MDRIGCKFQSKFANDVADGTFSGYGAVFGNEDRNGDVILKGAFKDSLRDLKKSDVWPPMLLQHGGGFFNASVDDTLPIGIWTDLREDDVGLYAEGKIAIDTQRGKEVYGLMKMQPRPALNSMSIGFRAKEFTLGTKPGEPYRTLKKIELIELSLVTMPANTLAQIDAVKGGVPTERQFEDWLVRDAGLSRSQAKTIISSGFKSLKGVRDAAGSEAGLVEAMEQAAQRLRSA